MLPPAPLSHPPGRDSPVILRALRIAGYVIGGLSASIAAIGAIALAIQAAMLDRGWASDVIILGLFGGIACVVFGILQKRARLPLVLGGVVGGIALIALGAPFTPSSKKNTAVVSANAPGTSRNAIEHDGQLGSATVAAVPTLVAATPALPAATPTVAPPPIEARVTRSIQDNRNAVSNGGNLDGLLVSYESGLLTVRIQPSSPKRDTELLTSGSAMVIIAGKAVWTTYPDVQRISVQVFKGSKEGVAEQYAVADYSRENAQHYDWSGLKNQPSDDNKKMFCNADFFAVNQGLWGTLDDKGCMRTWSGGPNPTDDERDFVSAAATASAPKPPTPRPPTATATPNPSMAVLAAGQSARSGGMVITVLQSEDPFIERNQFEQPASGSHFVRFKFRIENVGKEDYSYFRSNFRAFDDEAFQSNSYFVSMGLDQALDTQHLAAGARFEGWIVFQFRNGKKVARVEYSSFYAEDSTVTFTAP